MKRSAVVSVAVAATSLVACSSDSSTSAGTSCATFTTSLTVRDRMSQPAALFNTGEPITFELTTTNTNAPATLTAGSSCTAVVFEIFDATQRRRWGNTDGIACFAMLQPRTYAPLEVVVEADTWDPLSAHVPLPAGAYTVTANVGQYASDPQGTLVDCRAPLSKTAGFTIQ